MSSGDVWLMIDQEQQEHNRHIEKLDEYKRNLVNNIKGLKKGIFCDVEKDFDFRFGIVEGLDMVINLIDPDRILR